MECVQVRPLRFTQQYSSEHARHVPAYGDRYYATADRQFIILWKDVAKDWCDEAGWYIDYWFADHNDLSRAIGDSGIMAVAFARRKDAVEALESIVESLSTVSETGV